MRERVIHTEQGNNNNNNNVIHTIIHTHNILGHTRVVRSVSFASLEDKLLLKDFMEKAYLERERYSDRTGFNRLVKKAMREYMVRNPLPNPQVTLERALNINQRLKPTNVCCVEGCKTRAYRLLRLKNFEGKEERFQVCFRHRRWKHPSYRHLISWRKLK